MSREHQPEVIEDVMAVTTRAQYSKQKQKNTMLHQADEVSETVPMALDVGAPKDLNVEDSDTTEVQELPTTNLKASLNPELQGAWMSEFDESIFEASKVRPKLMRRQKRDNCKRHNEMPFKIAALTNLSREQFRNLQKTDQRP